MTVMSSLTHLPRARQVPAGFKKAAFFGANQALTASGFVQFRLGALVTRPFLMAAAETRM